MLIPFYRVLYHVFYCIGSVEINSPGIHEKIYYMIKTGSISTVIFRNYEPKYVRSSLFCDIVFCFVSFSVLFVCMCTVLLPPGGYPTAVNKYIISYHIMYHIIYHISHFIYHISYHIIYHIISYHIIYCSCLQLFWDNLSFLFSRVKQCNIPEVWRSYYAAAKV
jgi:hypothetical protein